MTLSSINLHSCYNQLYWQLNGTWTIAHSILLYALRQLGQGHWQKCAYAVAVSCVENGWTWEEGRTREVRRREVCRRRGEESRWVDKRGEEEERRADEKRKVDKRGERRGVEKGERGVDKERRADEKMSEERGGEKGGQERGEVGERWMLFIVCLPM